MDSILEQFPPVDYAFAYGSGIFDQPGLYKENDQSRISSRPMIDLIFAVDDPVTWHAQVRRFIPSITILNS